MMLTDRVAAEELSDVFAKFATQVYAATEMETFCDDHAEIEEEVFYEA